ncbi:DUF1156 domain-containing protein [Vibrio fluvialis]|nr:DUF1156 domain-containing protein [Vibrio fluvialis]MBY7771938.1 DUF1156 domain-containing protein [Vibrio fluvialis]MBY7776281.1 DUF1156 domain-containing protein [Vibrio fluvialis]MBY7985597.1 DUF1156 domain-containing protein [Vibrio fluvialis]MBY7989944.1 DUF1156 domain-containing protein [Vibrio fluvialis]
MTKVISPKKLIEVALPLDDINAAAAREKSIRHGHPSTLHLWWARRPLAAARAVIFAQMVNDPSETVQGDKRLRETKLKIQKERENLFDIIRELVKWENTNNEEVLNRAREAIKESWRFTCELNKKHPQADELFNPEKLPGFHDPFAGGGAIPLEAQRLGLESYASDLNPVAVMINKAMIEIPPKFAGQAPVGPIPAGEKQGNLVDDWSGAKGLAEDVRRYGCWFREQALKRLNDLYPKVVIDESLLRGRDDLEPLKGKELTVISWIWARTVPTPNPAFGGKHVPLMKSFALSTKKGKSAYLHPVIERGQWSFDVRINEKPDYDGTVGRSGAKCVLSGSNIPLSYIREQAKQGNIKERLVAIVCDGPKGRVYLPAIDHHESAAKISLSVESDIEIEHWAGCTNCVVYGYDTFAKLFTARQINTLNTLTTLISDLYEKVSTDSHPEYAKAISTYLAFAVDKVSDYSSSFCGWIPKGETLRNTYGRQAIPMVWDFAESNPISTSTGSLFSGINQIVNCLNNLPQLDVKAGTVKQSDAATQDISINKVISSDPPYYDNVPYSNLSDFFYMWLRRSLKSFYPDLFSTIAVPKMPEIVANQFRHGGRNEAEQFFVNGMFNAIKQVRERASPSFPISLYYAFKQSDTNDAGTSNSGWDTFLQSIINAGYAVTGTWPVRTERSSRTMSIGMNALASSVVLICSNRSHDAETISRRQFQRELRERMPEALEAMIGGTTGVSPIAPVDLAQAAIGPGMAIFSKYEAVLNQDGSKMSVHDALILINRAITDYLNPDSGNFDNDTLFCDSWFSQYGWGQGQFGEADTLARAKGTSVDGVRDAGVVESGGGKVRLLKWSEYPTDWDPKSDTRIPVWEACHQMIRVLNQNGEAEAGALLARMPDLGEQVRQLAYHLYTLCERKKWAEEARAYNELIGSWHAIVTASNEVGHRGEQHGLDFDF